MADKTAAPAAEPPKPVHVGGESFLERLRPYMKQIAIGTGVLLVVLIVIVGLHSLTERKERASTEKLDQVLEVARRPVLAKDQKPDPKQPSFASEKARADAVLATPGAEAAGPAFRGGLLLDAGKIDEAIAEYRKGTGDKALTGVLSREGLGLALEAKAAAEKDAAARQKGLEEALAAFVAMQPEETGLRRSFALYHQGRMQLLLGKRAEAKTLFEAAKTANKDNDPEIAELVEKRLASLGAS